MCVHTAMATMALPLLTEEERLRSRETSQLDAAVRHCVPLRLLLTYSEGVDICKSELYVLRMLPKASILIVKCIRYGQLLRPQALPARRESRLV